MVKRITGLFLAVILLCNSMCVFAGEEKKSLPLNISSNEACLMEAKTGKIIFEKNQTERVSPASITKIMTLLLIYEQLESGKIKKSDIVTTSAHAKSMGGSQVFLEEGEQQTVETLIKCIVIASGNDASVAMAEHIAGSEQAFVQMMNEKAAELGMENTHFEDCCGLTDSDNHYSCAKDVAIMSRELVGKYPDILNYSSIWMETIIHKTDKGEKEFVLSNTNKLLKTNEYVKGLKTGSTSKAKYCVSVVGEKDGIEIISVIMGAPDYKARFKEANEMLNYGFSNCNQYTDEAKNNILEIKIKDGTVNKVKCGFLEDFNYISTEKEDFSKIKKEVEKKDNLIAPIKKGDVLGKVKYSLNGKSIGEMNLISFENVKKATFADELIILFKSITGMI